MAAGAATTWLAGCTAAPKRPPFVATAPRKPPTAALLSKDEFRALAKIALEAHSADHLVVRLYDRVGGTVWFREGKTGEYKDVQRRALAITAVIGRRQGGAAATDLTAEGVQAAVRQAEEAAQAVPEDPEYVPPLPPQRYPVLPTLWVETLAAGREWLRAAAVSAISICRDAGLSASGLVACDTTSVGLAASTDLFAFEQRSRATCDVTASGRYFSGPGSNVSRSIGDLDVAAVATAAVAAALKGKRPRPLAPGEYSVILAPDVVADLLAWLMRSLDARSYHAGTSPVQGQLDQQIIDERLSVRNDPFHPDLLGFGFNDFGLPTDHHAWIERGVLRRLHYDRLTAQQQGTAPTYFPDALCMAGAAPDGSSVDDLIRGVGRGVLVTRFGAAVIPDADGYVPLDSGAGEETLLIEGGQLMDGLLGIPWKGNPLRAFRDVEAIAEPQPVLTENGGKMLVPAMRLHAQDF